MHTGSVTATDADIDVFTIRGRLCVTVLPQYTHRTSRGAIVAVDHSGSMRNPIRAHNAKKVLQAVAATAAAMASATSDHPVASSASTAVYGFGNTASFTTPETYMPLNQGTLLVAAADALLYAEKQSLLQHSGLPVGTQTHRHGHWACAICSSQHAHFDAACRTCLTPYSPTDVMVQSVAAAPATAVVPVSWACPACTFLNNTTAVSTLTCQMCETPFNVTSASAQKEKAKDATTEASVSAAAAATPVSISGVCTRERSVVVVLTDCEQLSDHRAAIARRPLTLFDDRAWLMFGSGPCANIHDLMALVPIKSAEQGFYISVSDSSWFETPTQAIRDVMHSVSIKFRDRTVYVKPGMSYLVPAGIAVDELYVNGAVVAEADAPSRPVTNELLDVVGLAIRDSVTRRYNGVLSMLKAVDLRNEAFVFEMDTVRRLIDTELSFIEDVIGIKEVLDRAEQVASRGSIGPVGVGVGVGVDVDAYSDTDAARARRRDTIRRGVSGVQELLDMLRQVKRVVQGPVNAAAYTEAMKLFNATSRGNMSEEALLRLGTRVAGRVKLDAYEEVHKLLTSMTSDRGSFPDADALDDAARHLPDAPYQDVITGDEDGCLVAVGDIVRRELVGAMNPCDAWAKCVDSAPYDVFAVHMMNVRFRSAVGQVNGIVGVFPGNSQAASIAFSVIASVIGTGAWTTPVHGQLGLFSLLIGVEKLLKQGRTDTATVLALGWAGVAARVKSRVMLSNGTVSTDAPALPGLTAAAALLIAAAAEPWLYMGPQIMRPGLWLALDFATAKAQEVLGTVPMWDRAALQKAALVQEVVSAASWAMQPLHSKGDTLRYSEEVKTLWALRRDIYLRIGYYAAEGAMTADTTTATETMLPQRTPLRPAVADFLAVKPAYTYTADAPDGTREGVKETAFLDMHLRDVTAASGGTEARRAARAAFWTAVANDADRVSSDILAAFNAPDVWEASVVVKAVERKHALLKSVIEGVERLCVLAFNNAVDDALPLTFFDVTQVVLLGRDGTTTRSPISGVSEGRPTGMPSDVCTALDSPYFLQPNSVGRYRSATYANGVCSYAPALPALHSTLAAWARQRHAPKDADAALQLACATGKWSDVPDATREKYVKQWFFQKRAHEIVATWPLSSPMTLEAVCDALGVDTTSSLFASAAEWHATDDTSLRESLYGGVKEWSYEMAVVAFYISFSTRDSVTGAWNAQPLLAALSTHRRFVLPRHIYDTSLLVHGCAKPSTLTSEVFSGIVNRVYNERATKPRHG